MVCGFATPLLVCSRCRIPDYSLVAIKHAARSAVAHAVRVKALLKPERCEHCKEAVWRLEAHHLDYTRPLDVRWLCTKDHHAVHSIYEAEGEL